MTTYTNCHEYYGRTGLLFFTLERWTGGSMTARHARHLFTASTDEMTKEVE